MADGDGHARWRLDAVPVWRVAMDRAVVVAPTAKHRRPVDVTIEEFPDLRGLREHAANVKPTVYVLHFVNRFLGPKRLAHAGHYIGYCGRGLDSRMTYHRSGRGSRLLAAVMSAGGDFVVALALPGDRRLERALKNAKDAPRRFCPVCRGEATIRRHWRSGTIFVAFRPHLRAPLTARIAAYSVRNNSNEEHASESKDPAGTRS